MINNINALKEYTVYRGEKSPRLKDKIVLKSPGCDLSGIAKIKKAFPDMPENYLTCAQTLNLSGIAIGYFQLSPPGSTKIGFIERLLQINNSEINPLWNFMSGKGLYEIAAWEAEPICVATNKSPYQEGAVLMISTVQPIPKESLHTDNFESFLLIAGNLDAIRDRHFKAGDKTSANIEFEQCLARFSLPTEALNTWKQISKVVLS